MANPDRCSSTEKIEVALNAIFEENPDLVRKKLVVDFGMDKNGILKMCLMESVPPSSSLKMVIDECPNQNLTIKVRDASIARIERQRLHSGTLENNSSSKNVSRRSVALGKPIGKDRPLPSKNMGEHGKSEALSRNSEEG